MSVGRCGAIIVAAALLLALPVLVLGYPRAAHDAIAHIFWATHFSRLLWSGTLYPRWALDMNGGLGSPVFFYYQPLSYYLAALFDFGSDRMLSGAFQLRIAAPVVLICSGLACFVFLRGLVDRTAALIGAVAYMAMPYHLIDLYIRGDFPEFTAFVFIPLVLASVGHAVRQPFAGVVATAVSFGALVLCHPLAALVASPLFAGYTVFLFLEHRSWSALAAAAGGAVLGMLLAAVFLVPALTMQHAVFYQKSYIAYAYLFYGATHPTRAAFQHGLWAVLLLSVAMFTLAFAFRNKAGPRKQLVFWSVAGLAYCFFMTRFVTSFWVYVKVTHILQFPYRLHIAAVMALAACVGLYAARLSPRYKAAALAVFMLLGGAVAAVPVATHAFRIDPAIWAKADTCPETSLYRPIGAAHWICGARLGPLKRDPSDKAWLEDGRSAEVSRWESRSLALQVSAPKPETLYIRQFAFPGWTAVADERLVLQAVPAADGILAFTVPKGRHRVAVTLEPLPAELWGERISLAACAALLVLAGLAIARRRKVPYAMDRKA
jgi:hypothetical protein